MHVWPHSYCITMSQISFIIVFTVALLVATENFEGCIFLKLEWKVRLVIVRL